MDLMSLLPPIYENNATMQELQGILSTKINTLSTNFSEVINECFVKTASNLLSRYEQIYGIEVDVNKSIAFRRERITAKAKGVGTITAKMLEDVATSYSNGEVEVIEYPSEYRFVVKFVGTKGIPPNMADLTLTIEEIKPAHLAFSFEYTYNTYEILSIYTHGEMSAYTQEELSTHKFI